MFYIIDEGAVNEQKMSIAFEKHSEYMNNDCEVRDFLKS
jgi:hypothetical protein